jgi:hypothetical protein
LCISNLWIISNEFIKVKLPVLFITEYHAMKAYWGVEVQLHVFFDLGTKWR